MASETSLAVLDGGDAALPRDNGELVFAEPWEGRVFGVAVALAEEGLFTLSDFQGALIRSIARWESLGEPVEEYRYYECWLGALEELLAARAEMGSEEIDRLAGELLERPAGHDHAH